MHGSSTDVGPGEAHFTFTEDGERDEKQDEHPHEQEEPHQHNVRCEIQQEQDGQQDELCQHESQNDTHIEDDGKQDESHQPEVRITKRPAQRLEHYPSPWMPPEMMDKHNMYGKPKLRQRGKQEYNTKVRLFPKQPEPVQLRIVKGRNNHVAAEVMQCSPKDKCHYIEVG